MFFVTREISKLEELLTSEKEKSENLAKDLYALQQQLSIEKTANEAEKRRNNALQVFKHLT